MQSQRDIGILGAVLGGAINRDSIEADLLGTFARNILKFDRFFIKETHRHRIHVMRLVALQHVIRKQGVVRDAAHLNAVIKEHVFIVLRVLRKFLFASIFKPRFECCERCVER